MHRVRVVVDFEVANGAMKVRDDEDKRLRKNFDIFDEKKSFCMNWGVVCFLLTECWRVAILQLNHS